jgi:lipopolysaccharide heptosyltransferase III
MASVLERVRQGGRILVIRLRSLGDCVLTTPALELLKRHRPDVRIGVVVEKPFQGVFEGNPDIGDLLESKARVARAWRPDLTLNLHGGSRSVRLTAVSGATFRAGFEHFRNSFVYNVRIPTAQEILHLQRKVHTCEHLASAVFYLGVPMAEIPRAKLFADAMPSGQYALLHPVASQPDKTWPADRFLAVAGRLEKDCDLEPVFIGGAGDDLAPFRQYRTIAGAPLATVKSLVARAMLFVGNDSGPAHMAAAFNVPSIVIFGSSDPAIWGPWRTTSEILTHAAGISAVPVEAALEALDRVRVQV